MSCLPGCFALFTGTCYFYKTFLSFVLFSLFISLHLLTRASYSADIKDPLSILAGQFPLDSHGSTLRFIVR